MRSILGLFGSLWFTAVLLMALLVAMACATVFESSHGSEHALVAFYLSDWFVGLLGLVAANVLAALALRYPFSKRQAGFVVTHIAILVVLAGAYVTNVWGVEGQLGIAEGQSLDRFNIRDRDTLTVTGGKDRTRLQIDLDPGIFSGFTAVDNPSAGALSCGDARIDILRYLPDSSATTQVVDDNPLLNPAVEVSLLHMGRDTREWIFANNTGRRSSMDVAFRCVADEAELADLIEPQPVAESTSRGIIRVEHAGSTFELSLKECSDQSVGVGDSGYAIQVLQYFPDAKVSSGGKIRNASDRPVNPAVEIEITGPAGSEKRVAFSKFPDFMSSMHGGKEVQELKVTFVASSVGIPSTPIEVLSGPSGGLYVRVSKDGGEVDVRKVEFGTPVDTPWPGLSFAVLRRFEHARLDHSVEAVEPVRETRMPAILVKVDTSGGGEEMWLRKHEPRTTTVDGVAYKMTYGSKVVPLGFTVTLDDFKLGRYPGEQTPRSFESHITITDPTRGGSQSRVIGMNHPTDYGGYTFYQSSYRQERGTEVSFLSVSRDYGTPIVFVGYIALMVGMLVTLCTRLTQRKTSIGSAKPETAP